jgi:hypothetical protein
MCPGAYESDNFAKDVKSSDGVIIPPYLAINVFHNTKRFNYER